MASEPALAPIYWPQELGQPVTLYEGPLDFQVDGSNNVVVDGAVRFEWQPSPHIRVRVATDDIDVAWSDAFLEDRLAESPFRPPAGAAIKQVDSPSWDYESERRARSSYSVPTAVIGVDEPISTVVFNLVNSDDARGGPISRDGASWSGRTEFEVGDWRIVFDSPPDCRDVTDYLGASGLFAFTHVARLERTDGEQFTWADAEDVRNLLFHLLAFTRGALVGLALPVGLGADGAPRWARWECTSVDRWSAGFSWCDNHHQQEAMTPVAAGLAKRYEDSFWQQVIRRAIRYYVEANRAGAIDARVPTAQAGLELLAWAVLEDQGWLERGEDGLDAAGRIRLLLKWADIPTAVPAGMSAMEGRSHAFGQGTWDGPRVLTHVRRDLIHAPKKTPEWPSTDLLVETWRVATWYLELILLRLLGYTGSYASRLIDGRFQGTVEPVPWSR